MQHEVSNTKGAISLSLGIISIVCAVGFFYTSVLGLILGITAMVLDQQARKEVDHPIAAAGFICGIIGTFLCGLLFVSCSFYVSGI